MPPRTRIPGGRGHCVLHELAGYQITRAGVWLRAFIGTAQDGCHLQKRNGRVKRPTVEEASRDKHQRGIIKREAAKKEKHIAALAGMSYLVSIFQSLFGPPSPLNLNINGNTPSSHIQLLAKAGHLSRRKDEQHSLSNRPLARPDSQQDGDCLNIFTTLVCGVRSKRQQP